MKHRKQAIILLSICIVCTLAITIYLFAHNVTSVGYGMEHEGEGGGLQSINGYGGLFISFALLALLMSIIYGRRK